MAKAKSDIANTAVRIFLQDFGAEYDEMRDLPKYAKRKHLPEIKAFFGDQCCYCGVEFGSGQPAVQDHLVPLNRTDLGLHAWGNIVPSCAGCNAAKQGKPWHEIVADRAGNQASERYKRITDFVAHYQYEPPFDLAAATADLYAEAGEVTMALVRTKIRRTREAT
jgi:hypothetical protein